MIVVSRAKLEEAVVIRKLVFFLSKIADPNVVTIDALEDMLTRFVPWALSAHFTVTFT